MSTLNVDKVDPSTGTALELGTSGDTITVPTGAGLTVVDEVKTNKVSPATGTAFALGDSGDTFTVPSGATIVNSGTATGFGITAANFRPNAQPFIYNANMAVTQRAATTSGFTGNGYPCMDRWRVQGANYGTFTFSQDTSVPDNVSVKHSYKMDCTTADASYGASDHFTWQQRIEGNNFGALKYGTSDAEATTVSFWVKSNLTGDFLCYLYGADNDRFCCKLFSISTTNTWEQIFVNFPGDTTGAINADNGYGLSIGFGLGFGSDFTSGTLATTWAAWVDANWAVGMTNNLSSSTSNDFYITGVQMEVGTFTSASDMPIFQSESYEANLARCQRYYFDCNPGRVTAAALAAGAYTTSTNIQGAIQFPVAMRDNPTMYEVGGSGYWAAEKDTYDIFDDITIYQPSLTRSGFNGSGNVSATGNDACLVRYRNTSARLAFDAEL